MPEYFQVMTTTDSPAAADTLSAFLIEQQLAACVQTVGPITSRYRWEGTVETAEEWLLIVKTTGDRLAVLIDAVETNHSYDVPEVTATPIVGGSDPYLSWLSRTLDQ